MIITLPASSSHKRDEHFYCATRFVASSFQRILATQSGLTGTDFHSLAGPGPAPNWPFH